MEAVFSLLPSDEPTREPIAGFEELDPTPVFLLPPESDPAFQKACLMAKTATSRATSVKQFHKDNQKRWLAWANRWVYATENCPVTGHDEDGNASVKELSDFQNWKRHPKIIPKLLALGEKYHEKETVEESDMGNFLDEQ